MTLQKIINYIKSFSNKRKRRNNRKKLVLGKLEQTSFTKKRKNIIIKNTHLEKLKIFGNNITHYYILILVLLLTFIGYIVFGPIFKVKNIEIIKQDSITNMIISYKAVENFRGQSIWKPEKNDILKSLKNYQHNIRSIKTDIMLPSTLKIIIDSYKGIFNTTINDKTFTITENGTLIPAMYSEEYEELIVINKFEKSKFLDYKKVLDTVFLAKISNIDKTITENIIDLKIKNLTYYVIERELHIDTEKNTKIIFDLNGNPKEQIEKLAIFNKEHININKNPIIYIDLRVTNKVFYCTSEEEYKCIQNLKSIYKIE